MGRSVLRLAAADPRFDVVAIVSRSGQPMAGVAAPVMKAVAMRSCPSFDLAIDFSLPDGFDALLDLCVERGAALISGTTGLDDSVERQITAAARSIPVLWASNFSVGIVVLEELARRAALALAGWDIAITETHHVHKLDAPSGTALTLAAAMTGANRAQPLIRSVREGEVVGEHLVRLTGNGESLELIHRAEDRDIFARGALEAAVRLCGAGSGRWFLREIVFGKNVSD